MIFWPVSNPISALAQSLTNRPDKQNTIPSLMRIDDMLEIFSELAVKELV
jgi:hypothetical protein